MNSTTSSVSDGLKKRKIHPPHRPIKSGKPEWQEKDTKNISPIVKTALRAAMLLRAQYGLNPNGEQSFGIAIEECHGGIRYVAGCYRSATAAKQFWLQHHWY